MATESKRFALARSAPDLFAYGSLLLEAVIAALLDRVPDNELARAPGYRVSRLPDQPFPGLVHDASSEAHGRIYRGLSPKEWAILDAFENSLYKVQVVTLEDTQL
ncbi:hypothetical protein F5883DRAFT_646882 [Diaporthe sp. PMI_573]|nr:hypothetical protein F5883DRAFT_646882 [Diaporthaceae sp. PMI_573]